MSDCIIIMSDDIGADMASIKLYEMVNFSLLCRRVMH